MQNVLSTPWHTVAHRVGGPLHKRPGTTIVPCLQLAVQCMRRSRPLLTAIVVDTGARAMFMLMLQLNLFSHTWCVQRLRIFNLALYCQTYSWT